MSGIINQYKLDYNLTEFDTDHFCRSRALAHQNGPQCQNALGAHFGWQELVRL